MIRSDIGSRDWFRLVLHMPVGWLTVALLAGAMLCGRPAGSLGLIALAVLLAVGFLVYEVTQGSQPHKDIRGWLWGLAQGGIAWLVIILV